MYQRVYRCAKSTKNYQFATIQIMSLLIDVIYQKGVPSRFGSGIVRTYHVIIAKENLRMLMWFSQSAFWVSLAMVGCVEYRTVCKRFASPVNVLHLQYTTFAKRLQTVSILNAALDSDYVGRILQAVIVRDKSNRIRKMCFIVNQSKNWCLTLQKCFGRPYL